jgi:hypothetical protein
MLVEYHAELTVDGNEFQKDKMIMHLNDNATLFMFNNRMVNVQRPQAKEGGNERLKAAADSKVKTISIRSFSKATIEGNVIQGDYDYAILCRWSIGCGLSRPSNTMRFNGWDLLLGSVTLDSVRKIHTLETI